MNTVYTVNITGLDASVDDFVAVFSTREKARSWLATYAAEVIKAEVLDNGQTVEELGDDNALEQDEDHFHLSDFVTAVIETSPMDME